VSEEKKAESGIQEGEKESLTLRIQGVNDCPVIYANIANITATPLDFQIVFGFFGEREPGVAEINAKAQVRIVMAPEHAGMLTGLMAQTVKNYMKQHGPLRGLELIPKDSAPPKPTP